jgi:hypothetical protein
LSYPSYHPALKPRRRRLWPIFIVPVLVVLAAAAWSGFWFYAAGQAEGLVDGWRAREAKAGRQYDCANRTIGGYPFRIEVRCAGVTAAFSRIDPPLNLQLGEALVVGQIYDPKLLIAEFTSPMSIAERGGDQLVARWQLGRASLRGLPEFPQRADFSFDSPAVDRITGAGQSQVFRAQHAEIHGRLAGGSVDNNPVIEIVTQLVSASMPAIHPLAAQPFNADISATLRGLKNFAPKPWAERFREIQANNGRIEIAQSRIQQGDLIAVTSGQLGLTPRGRLNGELQMVVTGIERVIPALGLDKLVAQGVPQSTVDRFAPGVNARDLNNVIGSLDRIIPGLGNVARNNAGSIAAAGINALGQPTTLEGKKALALPLRFVDGSVFIGPLQVTQTPPLF